MTTPLSKRRRTVWMVDFEKLKRDLEVVKFVRRVKFWSEVARGCNVSESSISRMFTENKNHNLDLTTMVNLLKWAELDINDYVVKREDYERQAPREPLGIGDIPGLRAET